MRSTNSQRPGLEQARAQSVVCWSTRYYAKAIKGERMLPEKQESAYEQFYASTANNEILEQKTTVMIQLAASFAIGCYP